MQKIKFYSLLIGIALLFMQCNSKTYVIPTEKCSENDPFKNTMVKSQYFEFSADEDQVKEGAKGTVIAFPKGCFVNKNGNVVTGAVKVELAEAFSMQDMINSNLTTSSDGKSLETAGMLFFNVKTADGQQLGVNANNPIHIEIPTDQRKAGMEVYKGERAENGMTNWIAPEPIKSYLMAVDFDLLNFLPKSFSEIVEQEIPFGGHQEATQKVKDELYYSLSGVSRQDLYKRYEGLDMDEEINKTFPYGHQTGALAPKDHYNPNDYEVVLIQDAHGDDSGHHSSTAQNCGIDPAIIKTIKNKKFAETFIATHAFETRLKTIFRTCRDDVLELYINNVEKDLWEVDELAAELLKYENADEPDLNCLECTFEEEFLKFAAQKLTNVKGASKNAALLKAYYQKQLKAVQDKINATNRTLQNKIDAENEAVKEKVTAYKELLWQREKYRMETYGFEYGNTGWVNVDKPAPKRTDALVNKTPSTSTRKERLKRLEVRVENSKECDRTYVYFLYTHIQSMRRLDTKNEQLFFAEHNTTKGMVLEENAPAMVVVVGYKGEQPYLAVKKFRTQAKKAGTQALSLNLAPTTTEDLNKALKQNDSYSPANRIAKDLEYQAAFAIERDRQKRFSEQRNFMMKLWNCANYCCKYSGHG